VLFCDLVDSTRLSRQLDPEDYRTVIRAYQEAAVAAIQPFDGYVAQYLGDGLLLYFGWPQAYEDAALRAVHASLAILDALGPLNSHLEPQYGVRVAVRLGLHTGLAVIGAVGSGTRQEALAMGDTPNITARIQGLAGLNTVALSATTARLVQGAFTLEDLGTHHLKGVTEPMPVFRLLGPREVYSDEVTAVPAPVPFLVGRNEEIGLRRRRWEQSKEGLGQVVLISGEAGIGKSTLVQALRTHVGREDVTWITCRCSPYHTNSVLYPIIEHLQRALRWQPDDPATEKLDKLEQALRTSRLPLQETVSLLAAPLSVPYAERYAPLALTPQQQKQQILDTMVAWLAAEAERQPVLVLWEDLHWTDPTTLELLGLFVDQAPTVPMLHVLTFRPGFVPPWPTRSHMTPLTLTRLERPQVEALITHLAGGKSLPMEVVQHIVAKTDGVPLFVEELTKMLLESELLRAEAEHYALTGSLSTVPIPATLQDSLMARLDLLPAARDVAQLGAVLGREFAYDWLRAVSPLDEATLQARLAQLVTAELLYQRGRPPRATYVFKHALIQDAAYAALLRSTRQQYHQRIAQMLATRFPEMAETRPALLAHHYTEAALPEDAVAFWHKAGQKASERSAYVEAIAHLRKGLEVLQALPETATRAQRELTLQLTLGESLEASQGYTAPEVVPVYTRVHGLCQQVDEIPQIFPALIVLRRFYAFRGEVQTAQELAEQLLHLAQRQPDAARLQEAHWALGHTLYFRGEFVPARTHLEQSMACYTPRPLSAQADRDAAGTQIACLLIAAWNLWTLGYADQALGSAHEALRLTHELAHPFTLVMSLYAMTLLHWLMAQARDTGSPRVE
jgi:class 3 adenylate cyclase/tetratricopeptide (TPR) repeat protein